MNFSTNIGKFFVFLYEFSHFLSKSELFLFRFVELGISCYWDGWVQ